MRNFTTRSPAGWHGQDSMRTKAQRAFKNELEDFHNSKTPLSASSTGREKMRIYKKGGHVKHHKTLMPKTQTNMHIPKRAKAPSLNVESMAEASKMKRGGKCYSSGGTVYEQEMRGMKPTHKKINYEKDMKGMTKGQSQSVGKYVSKNMKAGGSVGSYVRTCMKTGGRTKMAAGGVGKIRHKAMSRSGKPLKAK